VTRAIARSFVLSILLAAGAAPAQQDTTPPTKPAPTASGLPAGGPAKDDQQERDSLKARLERSIAENEQRLTRLKDGLARLNKGEPLDTVRDSMEPGRRPGGPDGPPGGPRGGRRSGPSGPHEPGHGPPPADANADKSDREVVLPFLEQHNPEFAERIKASIKDNPQMAERTIGRLAPHIREVLAERDDQTRELKIAAMRNGWDTMNAMRKLTDAIRKSPEGPEVEEQTARLRELMGVYFDTEVKLRNREIAVLEDRIAQIRKELGDRLSERDTFINKQMDRLLKVVHDRANRKEGDKGDKPAPAADVKKNPS
jgi:hypothetical protein